MPAITETRKALARALSDRAPPPNYWEALGQFVSAFSLVEENMQTALRHFSGVKPPIAQTLFSGTRMDAGMGLIKRIAAAKAWPKADRDTLDDIFKQLGEINRVRNDLLHYGARESSPAEWIISNSLAAHTAEQIRKTKISVPILFDMTADLYKMKIMLHLAVMHAPGASVPEAVEQALNRAWRYKPERPHHPRKKSPKPSRKQRRQRGSSQA